MKSIFFTAAAIAASVTGGCGDSKKTAGTSTPGSEALYKSEWKLIEVQGQAVPENSKASLAFAEGHPNKITGSTGCNRMNGTFELTGVNSIQFSPLATTRMACLDENANAIEKKFTEALSQANTWSIEDNMLSLTNGTAVIVKLSAQRAPAKEELKLNGAWELNYISGPKITFEGLFPNKKPLIIFDLPKTEVTGNGGCNSYSCKVKVAGSNISFGDALSTMMACEGNGEPLYFKTLKTVTSYSITGNTLTMIMGDIAVMRFTKK